MGRSICLFEDGNWFNLNPLVYFIPTYELRCGILTLKEKVEKYFSADKVLIHSRRYLSETIIGQLYNNILYDPHYSEDWIFINGRVIADESLLNIINSLSEECILVNGNVVIAAYLKGGKAKSLFDEREEFINFDKIPYTTIKNVETKFIGYPWDLIKYNGDEIINDFKLLKGGFGSNMKNFEGVIFRNRPAIFMGEQCEIDPFVFLNAEKGPIYIGNKVKIYSHASIEGPAYIGNNSVIKTHSSIYHNTSIGQVCKVGGEVENSIIHSFSNKQHHGFLGHSYLGQWINLGAGTSNSDLKNNYSNIRVKLNDKEFDSGTPFLGAIIGDCTKTAINSSINTGSVIGACCNIFSNAATPKYLPSFTWVNNSILSEYELDKIIETTKIMYSRRGMIFTDSDRKLFREVFNLTKSERIYNTCHV